MKKISYFTIAASTVWALGLSALRPLSASDAFPLARTVKSTSLLALGNANLAGVRNESALELNPAGLSRLSWNGFQAGGRNWLANTYLIGGSYFTRLPGKIPMGLALGMDYQGFGRTGIELYDANGIQDGTLDLGSFLVNAGFGLGLPFGLQAGLSVHVFNEKRGAAGLSQAGSIIALGLQYPIALGGHVLSLGGNLRNTVGGGYSGDYMLGAALELEPGVSLMAAFEPGFTPGTDGAAAQSRFAFNLGLSYRLIKGSFQMIPMLSWRQGAGNAHGGGINFGSSFVIGSIKLDLAGSYAHNIRDFIFGGGVAVLLKRHEEAAIRSAPPKSSPPNAEVIPPETESESTESAPAESAEDR